MQLQTYEPYRSSLLSQAELRSLYSKRTTRVIVDTIAAWLWIITAWVCIAYYPYWWSVSIAILVIGSRFYALIIIAHDGLHRKLFTTTKSNDLWNDLFILGSIGAITKLNRVNHMKHHRDLAKQTDPDRFKYTLFGRETPLKFLLSLTCMPLLVKAVRNVLLPRSALQVDGVALTAGGIVASDLSRYQIRDITIITIWQLALIAGLSFTIGWWAYLVLWVVPVGFALCCDILRVFCEHSRLTNDDDADSSMRLASFEANFIEHLIFSPNNMNHHIAHHLWPSIPYYNLPKAEEIIKLRLDPNSPLIWRSSYFRHLADYWLWLLTGKI